MAQGGGGGEEGGGGGSDLIGTLTNLAGPLSGSSSGVTNIINMLTLIISPVPKYSNINILTHFIQQGGGEEGGGGGSDLIGTLTNLAGPLSGSSSGVTNITNITNSYINQYPFQ